MTQSDDTPLPPAQELALEALLSGATIAAAARKARCSRRTLHRWLRNDYRFLANLNARRNDLRAEAEARLLASVHRAAMAIGSAVNRGNLVAAFGLLRGLGLLHGSPVAPAVEDASQLQRAAEEAEEDRRAEEEFNRLW